MFANRPATAWNRFRPQHLAKAIKGALGFQVRQGKFGHLLFSLINGLESDRFGNGRKSVRLFTDILAVNDCVDQMLAEVCNDTISEFFQGGVHHWTSEVVRRGADIFASAQASRSSAR